MIKKLLIANRGEIAARIIRTARRLGIETVLVVSEADQGSLAAGMADEVVLIGPAPATESYLRGDRIIAAARQTGAEAIHPGYGFLSENADFAAAVVEAGLRFVGPTASAMRALGGKAAAKAVAVDCGVPVVPGFSGEAQDEKTLRTEAGHIGYPVLIKAVDGGGGRGMRLVERAGDFAEALASAKREAASAFGSDLVLIEKVVVKPRHVEVQVFGDSHGNVVHLFERDCTLQRRNQKVIEEAPAPGMSPALREKMTDAAVRLAKAVGYQGAGTVEFLVEGGTLDADARWYFIEMNTRLQVEHPVTEEITGLDLVEWQLRVASGEPLPLGQKQITMRGHAIEVRLNAEDPAKGFMPSIGQVVAFEPPMGDGLRLETGIQEGGEISPYYDSMVAKLIAHADTREAAIDLARRGLEDMVVVGVQSNVGFLHALLGDGDVRAGVLDTGLIARELERLVAAKPVDARVWAAGVESLLDGELDAIEQKGLRNARSLSPWDARDAFQLGGERRMTLSLLADGEPRSIEASWSQHGLVAREAGAEGEHTSARGGQGWQPVAYQAGDRVFVMDGFRQIELKRPDHGIDDDETDGGHAIRAPINGKVAKIEAEVGAHVEKGARIAVVEAMKMEHVLTAPRSGRVARIAVAEGEQVAQGALVAALEEDEAP